MTMPASRSSLMDQPTILRLHWSSTAARYSQPSAVLTWEMSASHSRSGRSALKFRRTRSGAGRCRPSRLVSERRRQERSLPLIPISRIRRSGPFAGAGDPVLGLQLRPHPGRSVGAVRAFPDPGDLPAQTAVFAPALRARPPKPGVVALARDPQQAADQRQGVLAAQRPYEPEPHRRPCSRAKNDRFLQDRPLLAQGLVLLAQVPELLIARWWSGPR